MKSPVPPAPASVRIQTVAYRTAPDQLHKLIESLGAAVTLARADGVISTCELRVGDSSESAELSGLSGDEIEGWAGASGITDFEYDPFGQNLGSAGGNNRLAAGAATDYLLLVNPDTYVAPTMIVRSVAAVEPGVAAVEARQIPAEHPKSYDPVTWRTSWVNSSGLLLLREAFEAVGGLDPEHFFLHGDDVDLSWRLRLAGYELVTAPDSVSFHDKRFTTAGRVVAPDAERYHHIHSRLMLAARYGLDEIGRSTRAWAEANGDEVEKSALADFLQRRDSGRIPALLPDAATVAEPDGLRLSPSRW
jgi:GT2 family glycosyltransferase